MLQYQQPKENNQNKKKRKRIVIRFNTTYSKSVKTNIGRIFIKLISEYYAPNHKSVKIFNKNTIKLSYSCMPNIRSKINGHTKKILQPKSAQPQKLCNCLDKEDYPLNGLYFTSSILYQATRKCSDSKHKQKRYKGIVETTFKERYANHKKTFNLINSKNDTTLSTEYWTLNKSSNPRYLHGKSKDNIRLTTPLWKM